MSYGEPVVKDEKRRSERLLLTAPISCSVTLAEETSNDKVVFINVSDKGVRIMAMSDLSAKPGDAVILRLWEAGCSKTMNVRAVVRWRERQEFGLEFAASVLAAEAHLNSGHLTDATAADTRNNCLDPV